MTQLPFLFKLLLPISTLFTVVPPSLPMAMLFGIFWANYRLRKSHRIYCTNPKNIITCGSVNCVCFDKVLVMTNGNTESLIIIDYRFFKFFCIVLFLVVYNQVYYHIYIDWNIDRRWTRRNGNRSCPRKGVSVF